MRIPLVVIEEIDRFKKDQSETGRNARHFSRVVDELRRRGNLVEGIKLDSGGKFFLSINDKLRASQTCPLDLNTNDNIILSCALNCLERKEKVTLITKDINLRLKADILGICAEDYAQKNISVEELYCGHRQYPVSSKRLDAYTEKNWPPMDRQEIEEMNILPNEYFALCSDEKSDTRHSGPLLGRFCPRKQGLVPLINFSEGAFGIYPKNREQHFAFDALMNEDIKLVSLVGKAGTGKTLMAIAAGLEMAISCEKYNRLLVSRPVQPMGRDIGFLPGDISEKLGPWMQPIFDNMDFLFGQYRTGGLASYEELISHGLLHIEPLTYIRGRSIPKQYLIVDEAQNLSPHEVKTIITRAGEGTKIVLTGDCQQVDSPYLDEVNNGLVYALDNLKREHIVAHILLTQGERSELSEVASQRL